MGFIQAAKGAIGGTLTDQWIDFYAPSQSVTPTSAIFPGVKISKNNGRGTNTKANSNIITNGSKIIVPEGTALITIQDGKITNFIQESGAYEFRADDSSSKSIFSGDDLAESLIFSSWEKFKFGGIPSSQQLIFYVNLKEIPNNRFGTQSEIYWDDAFFGTQVGALVRGTYSLKIVDPILFVSNFVPTKYLIENAPVFDFSDMDNEAGEQLFNEVIGSLSPAFSNYTNDPSRGNRITKIQGDQLGFAKSLSGAVESAFQWRSSRGLEITTTAIVSIEYDQDTKELMKDVKKADALSGTRGNSFFQQAAARGIQAAGENGGGANLAFMNMGVQATGQVMSNMQQENNINSYQANLQQQQQVDPTQKLIEMKKLLDAGVITEEEFKKVKFDLLGF